MQNLYQQVILDHSRNPRHFQKRADAQVMQVCYNPMCGDNIEVYCDFEKNNEAINKLSFSGSGCAISMASASMMMNILQNQDKVYFDAAFLYLKNLIEFGDDAEIPKILTDDTKAITGMKAIAGVRQYPMRVKCATCAWHSMKGACQGGQGPIKTE